MPLVGFLMDTTLAAAHLVFAGVPERYPRIKWVLTHMGGAVPYLAERFDRGYEAFEECRRNISRAPSTYLKQFYFDTVNFDLNCIELAIKFAGADHILAGSDYPHQIGSIPKMVENHSTSSDMIQSKAAKVIVRPKISSPPAPSAAPTSPDEVQPNPAAIAIPASSGPSAFAVLNAEWLSAAASDWASPPPTTITPRPGAS